MRPSKKNAGERRGADQDHKFKFSPTYTVSNPDSKKTELESSRRPKDVLGNIISHTRPNSLLPYRELRSGVSDDTFELTTTFVEALRDKEAQQRIRTQKLAEELLQQAVQRRPDVQPVFVGSTERPGEMKQVRLSEYKPSQETLIPPKLNIQSGSALIGTDSESLKIPAQSPRDMSPDDKLLFDWWNARQAVRERRRDEEKLAQFVAYPLSNAIRHLITREEARLIKELSAGQVEGTKVSIAPSTKAASLFLDGTDGSSALSGTNRGIILPLKSMEKLFRDMRAMMHDTVITLLDTYRMGRRTVREVGENETYDQNFVAAEESLDDTDTVQAHSRRRESRVVDMEEMSIQLLLESERQLAAQAKQDSLLPSCVSLPPERIFTPCLAMETATSVALLWKILEQVRSVVPGMTFGLHLYEHYILPHLYDTFSSYSTTIPSLGGLSEQIMQLTSIPLRMEANRLASISYEQSKADSKYIEYAMKHWALRSWRKNVLDVRQREVYLQNVINYVTRLRQRRTLHAVFAAWRFEGRNLSNMNYLANVRAEYINFLNATDFPAEMPDDIDIDDKITNEAKTRLLATRLAETAVHVKGSKKEQAEMLKRPNYNPEHNNALLAEVRSHGSSERDHGRLSSIRGSTLVDPVSGRLLPPSPQTSLAKAITGIRSLSISMGSHVMTPRDSPAVTGPTTSPAPEVQDTPRPPTSSFLIGAEPQIFRNADGATSIFPISSGNPAVLNNLNANDMLPSNQPSVTGGPNRPNRVHDLQIKASGTFEEMLHKLKEMEDVCNHLRAEIGVQSKMLRKVEQERDNLRERNRQLEEQLLKVTDEKLHYTNLVQEKQFILNDRERRIIQLKSRIRAHRNRPWQRVVLRVVGEICSASTHISEAIDNIRIRKDQKPDAKPGSFGRTGGGGDDGDDSDNEGGMYEPSQQEEEERLFGKLAPIVLSSSYPLPDALIILQDWANACLDDLQDLDDLKGGALSTRFSTFSEEARNGILLSRLLFYLSLPRYLQRTANRDQEKAADGEEVFGTNYPDRRRQLLRKFNVQLDAPFPVYPECFGDLLSMRPSERMTLLLQFASELMAGSDMLTNDSLEIQRQTLYKTIFATTELQAPQAAGRIELQEVIDPHALAMGERASVVTFVALLYTRFSHPFNHKCRQSAEVEKAAIIHLLSGGSQQRSTSQSKEGRLTIEEEIMLNLEDEDKSPWYLFKERCLPVFGTAAHPFILRGNFWPSDAFDSPQLANILGELGMALNRSLQLHRWHVIMSCLVPVMTYSGLSRGVFTGTRASPQALRVGLEREGEWNVPLHCRCFMRVYMKRATILQRAIREGKVAIEDVLDDGGANFGLNGGPLSPRENYTGPNGEGGLNGINAMPGVVAGVVSSPHNNSQSGTSATLSQEGSGVSGINALIEREAQELLQAIHMTSSDLLTLFLRRSTLSAELALPTLSLGGWRLLCTDLKLLASTPEEEEKALLAMDVASTIFYQAVMALNEVATTTPEQPTTNAKTRRARAKTFTSKALPHVAPPSASNSITNIPKVSDDMTFAAFLIAMALVANEMYPFNKIPVTSEPKSSFSKEYVAFQENSKSATLEEGGPLPSASFTSGDNADSKADLSMDITNDFSLMDSSTKKKNLIWLGDCLQHFINSYIPTVAGDVLSDEPRAVIHRLTMGASTQEVLARYTPAIILVFNAYSKDVYGAAGMEKDDLLQLLRDAMLTSTEISPYLIFEVFQHCCVQRHAYEEEAAAKRREIDGKPRDGRRRAPRSVSIIDHRGKPMASGHQKDIEVLVYEGFVQFLCVLCSFKQPNPLIPYSQRLDVFLRRSVLRPLCHRVENLAPLLNVFKGGIGGTNKNELLQPDRLDKLPERRESRRESLRRDSTRRRQSVPKD